MLGSLRQNASSGTTWAAKITKRANHGPYLCLFLHMQLELGHLKPYSCPDPLGLHSDSHHPTEDSRPFNLPRRMPQPLEFSMAAETKLRQRPAGQINLNKTTAFTFCSKPKTPQPKFRPTIQTRSHPMEATNSRRTC